MDKPPAQPSTNTGTTTGSTTGTSTSIHSTTPMTDATVTTTNNDLDPSHNPATTKQKKKKDDDKDNGDDVIMRVPYSRLDASVIPRAKSYHHHSSSTSSTPHHRHPPNYNNSSNTTTSTARASDYLLQQQRDDSSYNSSSNYYYGSTSQNTNMNHHPHYYSHHPPMDDTTTQRVEDDDDDNDDNDDEDNNNPTKLWTCCHGHVMIRIPTVRQLALSLSLYCNIAITMAKFIAYLQTFSLSVLAAFLDSVLDVVSQLVLNYTEQRSSSLNTHHDHDQQDPDDNTHHHHHHHPNQRSSAYYPAGAARLEPIGVLTCAALMGMASFEVLKQSTISLVYYPTSPKDTSSPPRLSSVLNLLVVLFLKLALYWLCQRGAKKRYVRVEETVKDDEEEETKEKVVDMDKGTSKNEDADTVTPPFTSTNTKVEDVDDSLHPLLLNEKDHDDVPIVTSTAPTPTSTNATTGTTTTVTTVPYPYTATTTTNNNNNNNNTTANARSKHVLQMADPTMEALAQDHFNDCLSNAVAAFALMCNYYSHSQLWFVDPIGAIVISLYIIYSWYMTGKEQIEHLTGRSAPDEFIQEIIDMANDFDERITVDIVRAYHFGPKFLVEIEIVMNATTLLFESHDLGMDLQYEIEGREEVERCFVHIDYQTRPYDEHVVSKVPELREKFNITKQPSVKQMRSTQSI